MPRAVIVAVISAHMLAGCAATPATRSGFLGDYSKLVAADARDRILVQRPEVSVLLRYEGFMVEAPVVQDPSLDEAEARRLAAVFTEALTVELGLRLRPAIARGAGVLVVRSAITGARRSNVALNVATSLIGAPLSAGGVSAEAEVVDSRTGQRIAALSWSRRGDAFRDIGQAYASLGQARKGLREFAKRLVGVLDETDRPAR